MSETPAPEATFPSPLVIDGGDDYQGPDSDLGDAGLDDDLDVDTSPSPEVERESDGDEEHESTAGRAKTNNRPLIRRVAAKAQEVIDAPKKTRSVAAHVLGCADDMPSLVTAIMTADRGATQVFTDIDSIAAADVFEAAVLAGALGRERMKRVWSMLGLLGYGKSSNLNASNSKAAIEVAKAIHTANLDEVRGEIESVLNLLKKA